MKKYLHIVCDAGLANRLHAIVGAQDIAHVTGRELIIHWPVNRECGAPFKRLFKHAERYTFARREHILALLSTRSCVKVYNCGFHNTPSETTECYHVAADDTQEHVIIKSWYVPQMVANAMTVDIATQLTTWVQQFEPVDEVMNMLPDEKPVIGMHVRYGDQDESGKWTADTVRAYAVSRVEDFEMAMGVPWINRLEIPVLFIASHNPEVETRLVRFSRGSGFALPKRGERGSVLGMREAVADLWMLSRCRIILGSYWSQYSQLAAELGGVPLIKVGTKGWSAEFMAQLAKLT